MPVPLLKHLAKETGKSLSDAEKAWDEAKGQADKKFGDKKDDSYWSYVTSVTKKKLGVKDDPEKDST